jgi:AraC family transcriptional regulator
MDKAVERAIGYMWERYSEPLSLAEIAKIAFFSRFYFIRIFRDATGVSPGRFLAAVRIHQAKHLLLNTSMTITEVASAVGYNSLGSFTNYFTDSVGISPNRFRQLARNGGFELPEPERRPLSAHGTLSGTITFTEGQQKARVYVGAFATPIVQRRPVAAVVVDVADDGPVSYLLSGIPEGTWFVNAVGTTGAAAPGPWTGRSLLIGEPSRVVVTAGMAKRAPLQLRPTRRTDPPVLLALPSLEPLIGHRSASPRRYPAEPCVSRRSCLGFPVPAKPWSHSLDFADSLADLASGHR